MKVLRYGPQGQELPAILAADASVRSLRPIVSDIDESVLSPDGMRFLEALDPLKLPKIDVPGRIGSSLGDVKEIIAIGLNYRQQATEANLPIPSEPVVFFKSTSSICGPGDDILLPSGFTNTDWEIELGIVIGSTASRQRGNTADMISDVDIGRCKAGLDHSRFARHRERFPEKTSRTTCGP
jgi:hypothetical protein